MPPQVIHHAPSDKRLLCVLAGSGKARAALPQTLADDRQDTPELGKNPAQSVVSPYTEAPLALSECPITVLTATAECRSCHLVKQVEDFWVRRGKRQTLCRKCQSEACRKSQEKHGWRAAYKAQKAYRANHPDRVRCIYRWTKYRQRHHLDLGLCRVSGCTSPAEGHHPNYADPYTVILMCRSHHMAYECGRLPKIALPAPVTFHTARRIKPIISPPALALPQEVRA